MKHIEQPVEKPVVQTKIFDMTAHAVPGCLMPRVDYGVGVTLANPPYNSDVIRRARFLALTSGVEFVEPPLPYDPALQGFIHGVVSRPNIRTLKIDRGTVSFGLTE